MSGAGRSKGDVIVENIYVEHKDANKTFTLNAADLRKALVQSIRQGNDGMVYVISFRDPELTCRITVDEGLLWNEG